MVIVVVVAGSLYVCLFEVRAAVIVGTKEMMLSEVRTECQRHMGVRFYFKAVPSLTSGAQLRHR